ncbi:MAG TPA: tRNA preQ1(34) S-adenosylmethionine ribosyltransferase-isomerase QueA [Deltaproteobacteria bacterium]|nr:tRNA preQ1(34) S-adenosylmethionine ribosyltransferase-isomerase QueA [Deltaproteobacteria bacterium]HQB39000.1 tRNA preQ1(34) S-adenosylmethionine ribosyltransferase-isomerase QueA [Deltaproteobacteria bacterium]
MLVKEFDYELPDSLIARRPAAERDASRLLVMERASGTFRDGCFPEIVDCLASGDLLVFNDTRVIPARLAGRKATGGKVEVFLVRRQEGQAERWYCLIKGSKGMGAGDRIDLAAGMGARICSHPDRETWLVEFGGDDLFETWLEREGQMPLPPYLQRPADSFDRERYQTVMAAVPGAVAAPTAGLHFTEGLLEAIRCRGVNIASITLHTGLGTFLPVRVERVEEHRIHTEQYSISPETALLINQTRERGGRIVAVGTTTTRTLEYAADSHGIITPGSGEADIFIYPGYSFKVVDALLTNFHLPESTLLMLVSAFAGRDAVLAAYRHAIADGYRFFSYGDAMFIA